MNDLWTSRSRSPQRQAELQSLKAQQAYLADQTSLATITVHLSTPEKYVPPPDALQDAGFLTGLKAGWDALSDVVVVALTVVGAVLPFCWSARWSGCRPGSGCGRRYRRSGPPAPQTVP